MPRRAARIDKNQPEIVEALRKAGFTVTPLHAVGGGCPDLLCGKWGKNALLEVKDENSGDHKHKTRNIAKCLTPDQHKYHFHWQGSLGVVWTIEEALAEAERQCAV